MLIAEATPDAAALGLWIQIAFYILLAVCGVVVAIVHVLQYQRKEAPRPGTEYVTRDELAKEITRLETDHKELRAYMQSRMHDLNNKLHAINIRIVWMMGLLTQLCGKQGIPIPAEPTISIADEA